LEYQGEVHYFSSHIFGRASERQRSDQIKHTFSTQLGITLVSIPFWWDKSPNTLAATLQTYRPDIPFHNITPSTPIPTEMPRKYQHQFKYIANASQEFKDQVDPTGW
jgi:hypothetical protein